MHIPNAVLDPGIAGLTSLAGVAGLAVALRNTRERSAEGSTVLMGTMAAFVFAAQMVNFPVGPGVSGHLLGGVLSAALLGPWAGAVVIAAVLIVQCLLFGDGGLLALGANFLNMGLIGAVGGHAIHEPIRRWVGGRRGVILGAMVAAWFSVLLASGAFALELGASGRWADLPRILAWMTLVHAAIGLGEAVITGLALRFILGARPDLLDDPKREPVERVDHAWTRLAAAGLAISLGICVFLAPLASEHPDGLEYVGRLIGFLPEEGAPPTVPVPAPDYQVAIGGLDSLGLATALAGALGTVTVFGLAWLLGRSVEHRASQAALSAVEPGGSAMKGMNPDAA